MKLREFLPDVEKQLMLTPDAPSAAVFRLVANTERAKSRREALMYLSDTLAIYRDQLNYNRLWIEDLLGKDGVV